MSHRRPLGGDKDEHRLWMLKQRLAQAQMLISEFPPSQFWNDMADMIRALSAVVVTDGKDNLEPDEHRIVNPHVEDEP